MNQDSTDIHFERGLLLYQQDRHAAAEAELRLALAANPDDASAHTVLALCLVQLNQTDQAADEVDKAVRLAPNDSFVHFAKAQVLLKQDRKREAEEAVREAIERNPVSADCRSLLANLLLSRDDARGAIEEAELGLAFEPNHAGCSALRTIALLRLGRTEDAAEETGDALRRDPQDALAHAGRGWALLHAKQPNEALTHFRECLRLDPTNEWARQGLIEALKARYWAYRQMLGFFLWMGRLSPGTQWGIILAIFLFQQSLAAIAEKAPAVRPFAQPVLYGLIGFGIMTWLADPLFTLLLRLNRFGRLVLNREETRQSNWIGGVLAFAIGAAVVSLVDNPLLGVLGETTAITAVVLLIPLSAVFRLSPDWRRKVMALYVLGMVVTWAIMVWCFIDASQAPRNGEFQAAVRAAWEAFNGNVLAGFLSALLANALLTIRRR